MKKCTCPEGPDVKQLTRMPGFTGTYCGECLTVLSSEKIPMSPSKPKVKAEKEPKPEKNTEPTPVPEVAPVVTQKHAFEIHDVKAIENCPTKADFVLIFSREDGIGFVVVVENDAESIQRVVNDPKILAGKYSVVEYSKADAHGVPLDGKIIMTKPKEELSEYLSPELKQAS